MNVSTIPVSVQWDEIQRAARERSVQRQNVLAKSYNVESQTASHEQPLQREEDERRHHRTVFTKTGQLQQSYIPKGTLFDKVA